MGSINKKMINVIIIGAGVVGAAIAYELSENPQLKITIIDENLPASGATGAALGVLMGVISRKTKGRAWKLRQSSIERYKTLLSELEDLTGINIPCNRQGLLKLRFDNDDDEKWQKLCKTRADNGYQLEMWDLDQLKKKCPHLNYNQIVGAIYSPQDLQINPTTLTQALLKGATLRGVNLILGQKVHNFTTTELNSSNNYNCCEVHTSNGIFKSDWVILSAGINSSDLTSSLLHKIDIRPVLGQALLLKQEQIMGNTNFQPVITANDIHIVPLGKGEYWVGATLEFPNNQGKTINNQELLEKMKQEAIAFCPKLDKATTMLSWSGKRPRPEGQSSPIIEKLSGYNNVILATGHYRNGVLLAPSTALKVSEMINN